MSRRSLAAFSAPVLSVVLLAGCGSDDSGNAAEDPGSDSSTPATPSTPISSDTAPAGPPLPACGDIWKVGATLPESYIGCDQGGTQMPAETFECSSGQILVTYGDTYWAVLEGKVQQAKGPLLRDPAFVEDQTVCRG